MSHLISTPRLLLIGLLIWLTGCNPFAADQTAEAPGQFQPPAAAVTQPVAQPGVATPQPAAGDQPAVGVAQAGTLIRLQPATQQLNIGQTVPVQILIENVTNLTGADVRLQFNPAVLQVQDADPGQDGIQIQPGNFPAPDFVAANTVTNDLINYALVQLPPTAPVSGSGLLATVTFQAIAQGDSDLIFTVTDLADNGGQAIPVTSQAGLITVGPGGEPPATATPTNTPLPGEPTATSTFTPIPGAPTFTPTSSPTLIPITVTPTGTPLPTLTPTFTPTPLPTNTPLPVTNIPPGATVGFCYRVQPGETLYSLGQQFNIDPQFISVVNDLHPPGHVYAQQVLFIPEAYGRGPNVYVLKPNQTMVNVADECDVDLDVLAAVNNLPIDATLQPGYALIVPRPPFPPPSRYPYPPPPVWPPICCKPPR